MVVNNKNAFSTYNWMMKQIYYIQMQCNLYGAFDIKYMLKFAWEFYEK